MVDVDGTASMVKVNEPLADASTREEAVGGRRLFRQASWFGVYKRAGAASASCATNVSTLKSAPRR